MPVVSLIRNLSEKYKAIGTPPASQNQAYTEDTTTDFANPERGWMARRNHLGTAYADLRTVGFYGEECTVNWGMNDYDASCPPFNGSAGQNPFRLDNYRSTNIPQSLLDELTTAFARARAAGIKLKVRFSYNYNSTTQDATIAWMETHISQLAPTLAANRDVIAFMDSGFAGSWGEWVFPTSAGGSESLFVSELAGYWTGSRYAFWWEEPYLTGYRRLADALFNTIHSDIMIGFRYPRDDHGYRLVFDGSESAAGFTNWSTHDHEANKFDGSHISRAGWYNDCLWTNYDDSGTFNYDGGEEALDIQAQSEMGRIAVASGETCAVGGWPQATSVGSHVLDTTASGNPQGPHIVGGPDVLYRGFYLNVYNQWLDEEPNNAIYNEISRKIGYRLVLIDCEVPGTVSARDTVTVTMNMKNVGWGKVYNKRPMDLIFVGSNGTFTTRLEDDVRTKLPLAGETVQIISSGEAPIELQQGVTYALYLAFPDPDPIGVGLDQDVRYSIRLANTGIWDGIEGRHNLGMSVVGGTPLSTLGGEGSTSTSLVDYPKTGAVYTGDWWVDPTSGTNGVGTEGDPFNNLGSALSAVSDGERIIVKAGTLNLSSQISRSTSWTTGIEVFNYGTDRPIIDATALGGTSRALYFTNGQREHWKGFEFRNGPYRGINIESSETTIEDCWVHHFNGDGIYVANFGGKGTSDNLIQDCSVWRLGDGSSTGTNVPDCFVSTADSGVTTNNNVYVRCFAANGPDDGFDAYRGRGIRFIDSVSFKAGRYWNGNLAGDGNGFKMGGSDSDAGDNYAIGCLSVENTATGFTHNEAANTTTHSDPNIVFAFCTAEGNGSRGFNTGGDQVDHKNVRRDCVITNNDGLGYVGPYAINLRDIAANADYANPVGRDYSLGASSSALNAGIVGGISNSVATQPTTGTATNSGASDVALEIALDWMNRDLT